MCMASLEAAEAEVVLEEEDEPKDWSGEEKGVDAVEDAAVTGKHGAGVLDACAALDGGFEEVAQLGGDVENRGEDEGLPERLGDVEECVAAGDEDVGDVDDQSRREHTAKDGGDGAYPGFAGAKAGGELAFAEGAAEVERGDIAGPDADHEEEDKGRAVLLLREEGNEGEGIGDVDEAEESLCCVREDLIEGRTKAVPGEEYEGEAAEDGELGFDGEIGKGDDEGQG